MIHCGHLRQIHIITCSIHGHIEGQRGICTTSQTIDSPAQSRGATVVLSITTSNTRCDVGKAIWQYIFNAYIGCRVRAIVIQRDSKRYGIANVWGRVTDSLDQVDICALRCDNCIVTIVIICRILGTIRIFRTNTIARAVVRTVIWCGVRIILIHRSHLRQVHVITCCIHCRIKDQCCICTAGKAVDCPA